MQDKILFYILSYDVWFYFSHLLLHTKYGYAWIHKHHHAVNYRTMRYSDAYVGHMLESPLQGMGMLFPLIFIEFEYIPFLWALLFVNVRGMMRHDPRFECLTGNHHLLHHHHRNLLSSDPLFSSDHTSHRSHQTMGCNKAKTTIHLGPLPPLELAYAVECLFSSKYTKKVLQK